MLLFVLSLRKERKTKPGGCDHPQEGVESKIKSKYRQSHNTTKDNRHELKGEGGRKRRPSLVLASGSEFASGRASHTNCFLYNDNCQRFKQRRNRKNYPTPPILATSIGAAVWDSVGMQPPRLILRGIRTNKCQRREFLL